MSEENQELRMADELDVRISFIKEMTNSLDFIVMSHKDLTRDNQIFFKNYLMDIAEDLHQILREIQRRSGKSKGNEPTDFFEIFENYRKNYIEVMTRLRKLTPP